MVSPPVGLDRVFVQCFGSLIKELFEVLDVLGSHVGEAGSVGETAQRTCLGPRCHQADPAVVEDFVESLRCRL